MIDLTNIQATLTERKYMRAARAFRCYLDLPQDAILAASLTALIDRKINFTMSSKDLKAHLTPALVVDVTSKGKKFGLVVETVYEHQNSVGPSITAMTGEQVVVEIRPEQEQEPKPEKRGTITEQALKGLHATFFQNRVFHEFLTDRTGTEVLDAVSCKSVYKAMMQVTSCREIEQDDYEAVLKDFNGWLPRRNSGGRG